MEGAYFKDGYPAFIRAVVFSEENQAYFCYFSQSPDAGSDNTIGFYYRPWLKRKCMSKVMSFAKAKEDYSFMFDVRSLEELPIDFEIFIMRKYEKIFGVYSGD